MSSGPDCDAAESAYESAEQAYLAAIRSGATPRETALRATELRELAEAWAKVSYARFFARRDARDEYARDSEIEAEMAE
ncbi:MAG TPA: hypothetical protein VGF63_12410, partial [Solirubrobacteraceae bacterium]